MPHHFDFRAEVLGRHALVSSPKVDTNILSDIDAIHRFRKMTHQGPMHDRFWSEPMQGLGFLHCLCPKTSGPDVTRTWNRQNGLACTSSACRDESTNNLTNSNHC
jgi:diadenosine tetraphosphatase ApaH/serine/threonine PP2A family protein phosphatase